MNNHADITQHTQYIPITPFDIEGAVHLFYGLIQKEELYRTNQLLIPIRMTYPIVDMAISLHSIMDDNRTCFSAYFERINSESTDNHPISPNYPTTTDERYLHRSDMSIYAEEHGLLLDYGNREGSLCEEITQYSHVFDEYMPHIKRIEYGYKALREITKPLPPNTHQPMKFDNVNDQKWALSYVNVCHDLEDIIKPLLDKVLLNFSDPRSFLTSRTGQSVFDEPGTLLLKLKLERLKEYLDEEQSVASRHPTINIR